MDLTTILQYASLFSLVISILSLYFSRMDIAREENNRKFNEINEKFREHDLRIDKICIDLGECLLKINLFWSIVEKDFSKFLRQIKTPEFDILLDKANAVGLDNLTTREKLDLINMIDEQLEIARLNEDSGRAIGLALYRAVVGYKISRESEERC